MAQKSTLDKSVGRNGSFDVTCVVGTVNLTDDAVFDPYVAALILIGEHGSLGTFVFPCGAGGEYRVTIDHTEPRERG